MSTDLLNNCTEVPAIETTIHACMSFTLDSSKHAKTTVFLGYFFAWRMQWGKGINISKVHLHRYTYQGDGVCHKAHMTAAVRNKWEVSLFSQQVEVQQITEKSPCLPCMRCNARVKNWTRGQLEWAAVET